jgi:hypothetical protein
MGEEALSECRCSLHIITSFKRTKFRYFLYTFLEIKFKCFLYTFFANYFLGDFFLDKYF